MKEIIDQKNEINLCCNSEDIKYHDIEYNDNQNNSPTNINNISNNFKSYVFFAVIFAIWIIICFLVSIFYFDLLDSDYFNIGPSDNLKIIGIEMYINTWEEYFLVTIFCFTDPFITYFIYDTIYCWISSSILNIDQPDIYIGKKTSFIFINSIYIMNAAKLLFIIGINFTQVDFFVYYQIGGLLAGLITTFNAIKKKNRIYLP